jgi:hypothetical protein
MAVFKSYGTAAVGSTPVDLYAPTSKAIVIGLTVSNVFGYGSSVAVSLDKATGGSFVVVPSKRVDPHVYMDLMAGNKLVLESGDTLTAVAADDAAFDLVVSVLEGVA